MPAAVSLLPPGVCRTLLQRLAAQHPDPRSELNFSGPFELLCAVMLSAQATDVSVNRVTPQLFARAPDPRHLSELSEEEIGMLIRSIGLWRTKARNLRAMAEILEREYGGQVPQEYEALTALPGVGSKTALVVLNVGFGRPVIAVDTHIFRVCCRTGLCVAATPREVEASLPDLVPDEFKLRAHHQLLLHGRYVCRARKPQCVTCCINDLCHTYAHDGSGNYSNS